MSLLALLAMDMRRPPPCMGLPPPATLVREPSSDSSELCCWLDGQLDTLEVVALSEAGRRAMKLALRCPARAGYGTSLSDE